MNFASQQILWLLALVPPLALLMMWGMRRRRRRLQEFGQWPQVARLAANARLGLHRFRAALITAATSLLILALARPQFGQVEETLLARGVDVMIAVDVSNSMLANDIQPTRLARAREQLQNLVTRLSGHRIGILAFAGAAVLQCPLTLDQTILHQTMSIVDEDAVGAEGTNIADAVRVAIRSFDPDSPRHRVLVLLTDGEDHVGSIDSVAQEAAQAQVKIFAVGIGTASGGPVPQFDAMGRQTGFRQDSGRPVLTRLQTMPLMTLARLTGGRAYETTTLGGSEIDAIARAIQDLPQRDIEEQQVRHRAEQFQAFLLPAIALLLLEGLLLSGRRQRRRRSLAAQTAAVVMTLATPGLSHAVDAARENNEGVEAHREGDYDTALQHYQQAEVEAPNTPEVLLNIGHLRYMQSDVEAAAHQFDLATSATDPTLRAAAEYNLGTAQLREAQNAAGQQNLDQALQQIDPSIESLRQSLIGDGTNMEARYNLELAMRLRDQWRQQQQQQQQQNQQGQNQQNQNQQNQQDQQNQQSQQNQSQQDQQNQNQQDQQNQSQQDQQNQNQQDQQQSQDQQGQQNQENQSQQDQQRQQQGQGQNQQQQQGQPPTPEQIAAAQQQQQAESLLDLIPFEEYQPGMRMLMGAQAAPPAEGPDW